MTTVEDRRRAREPTRPPATRTGRSASAGIQRKEDPRFVRGKGHYVDDIVLPGMLHGAILRAPVAHARLVSIDTTEALAHPKVHAVITGKDLEGLNLAWAPTLSADVQAVLATDKVRFQGQEVAFVVAEDRYAARDALELIDVEYEHAAAGHRRPPGAGPRTPRSSATTWRAGPTTTSSTGRPATRPRPTPCSPRADVVVTQEIVYPRVHPAPMETCGAVADFDPIDGKLTLYETTQAPHAHRTLFAMVAGIPEHKIRIVSPDIGGGFGNKVGIYPGYILRRRRLDRHRQAGEVGGGPLGEPDVAPRSPATTSCRARSRRRRTARSSPSARTCSPTTARSTPPRSRPSTRPASSPSSPAATTSQAAHCKVTGVYTNKAPGGVAYACSFRVTEAVYLVERMVDVLARKLEMDPAELRLKNFIRPEQFPYTNKTGWEYDSGDYEPAHAAVAWSMAGYDDLRREQAEKRAARRADGHRRLVLHRDRRRRPAQAHGHRRPRHGRRRRGARPPHRQGRRAALGADPGPGPRDDVRADRRRGARHPARGHRGRARRHRPDAVRPGHLRQPLDAGQRRRRWPWSPARSGTRRGSIAAAMLETRPEDLEWEKGRWFVKGDPSVGKTIQEIALGAHGTVALPEGIDGNLDAEVTYDPPNLTFPFGAYICVVDVDPGTGQVKVRRFIAVDDCGTRINPMIIEGQVHGGLTDGVGHGADGDHRASTRQGNCLGGSFMDYLIPTAMEVPDWETGLHGHAVAAPPDRRQGHRRVGHRRARRRPSSTPSSTPWRRSASPTWTCRCTPARVWEAMQGRATPPI